MKNNINLSLYKNASNAVVGDLYVCNERVLATTHPATIAAAIFAMEGCSCVFKSPSKDVLLSFPVQVEELIEVISQFDDEGMANFMAGFTTFSRFDFLNPLPSDDQAEIHLRVAIQHLPKQLVRVQPISPPGPQFKEQLKTRNNYIYFPTC